MDSSSLDSLPRPSIKRIEYLDFARSMAIVSVCLSHTSEATMHAGFLPFSVLHTVGRMGVPLFLMISGALILTKEFNSYSDILLFYRKYLLPLVITSELWIIIYFIYFYISHTLPQEQLTVVNLLQWMAFMDRFPLGHWWYMPMIIGLYVGVPFVSIVLKAIDARSLTLPIILIVLFWALRPVCIQYLSYINIAIPIINTGALQLDTSTWGGLYSLYMVLGYMVHNCYFKRISIRVFILLAIVSFAGCTSLGLLKRDLWYDNIYLLILGLCTLELLRRATYPGIIKKYLQTLSKEAFGIYVLHMPLVPYVTSVVSSVNSNTIKALFSTVIILLICHATVRTICIIRPIGRILFHYR